MKKIVFANANDLSIFLVQSLNDNVVHRTCHHLINEGSLLNHLTVPLKLEVDLPSP